MAYTLAKRIDPLYSDTIDRPLSLHMTTVLCKTYKAIIDLGFSQSTEIAMHMGVERRYLEQVMQLLVRSGLVLGKRGPLGGYKIQRHMETAFDIVEAVYGETDDPLILAWKHVKIEDLT